MLLVFEVNLEVGGRGFRPGCVELARAVETLDAWEEVKPYVRRDGTRLWHRNRRASGGVYGGVTHECLELVVGIYLFLLEPIKRGDEPGGGWGL